MGGGLGVLEGRVTKENEITEETSEDVFAYEFTWQQLSTRANNLI